METIRVRNLVAKRAQQIGVLVAPWSPQPKTDVTKESDTVWRDDEGEKYTFNHALESTIEVVHDDGKFEFGPIKDVWAVDFDEAIDKKLIAHGLRMRLLEAGVAENAMFWVYCNEDGVAYFDA